MNEGGAVVVGHLSVRDSIKGTLREGSFTGDPGRYDREVSGYGHLSPWGPLSVQGEPGTCGGGGCLYTGDFDR
jgi:hypothetical protein